MPILHRNRRTYATQMLTVAATAMLVAAGPMSGTMVYAQQANAEAGVAMDIDHAKILKDAGVIGVFATYKVNPDYYQRASAERRGGVDEVLAVVDAHKSEVRVDAYLTRGLSSESDFMLRVHAYDLEAAQNFLTDFKKTRFGMHTEVTEALTGITKSLNYITKEASQDMNAALSSASYSDEEPKYSIVVPIEKNAEWWNMSHEERLAQMEVHTAPTLEFLVNVKRKLYHSTGLDDVDFITYFETADLNAFNNLAVSLMQVPENLYHEQWGEPTILSTIQPIEDVVKTLSALK